MKDRQIVDSIAELLDHNKTVLTAFGVLLLAGWLVFQFAAMTILTSKLAKDGREIKLDETEEIFLYGFVFSFWAITTISFGTKIFGKN